MDHDIDGYEWGNPDRPKSPMVAEILNQPTTIRGRGFEPRPLFMSDIEPARGSLAVTDDGQAWWLAPDGRWRELGGMYRRDRDGVTIVSWAVLTGMGGWLVWTP